MVKSIWSFEYPADLYRFGNFAGVNSMAYLLSLVFFLECALYALYANVRLGCCSVVFEIWGWNQWRWWWWSVVLIMHISYLKTWLPFTKVWGAIIHVAKQGKWRRVSCAFVYKKWRKQVGNVAIKEIRW